MGIFTKTEELNSMKDLLTHQIKDLYDAEHRLLDALPKMAEAAHTGELQAAFREHHTETKQHVQRLEKVFELLGMKAEREACDAMQGLISEGEEVMNAKGEPGVLDAALITATQRVEHYEMAGYGACRNFARRVGLTEAADLLQQTLDEEGAADEKLTQLAETAVNPKA